MEEHTKREEPLSEELLHQITGGCNKCTVNRNALSYHTQQAEMYQGFANSNRQWELNDVADYFQGKADHHISEVQKAQTTLDALRQMHGRTYGRGESSGSQPANKGSGI
jgi:hypothetical protein